MNLNELYQEIILDHGKRPRNRGALPEATHAAEGVNPLCGDQVKIMVVLQDGRIQQVRFDGCGCAISTASASMMTEAVKGRTVEEAEALILRIREAMTREDGTIPEDLGEIQALAGVRQFPTRVKCATLSWHALGAALRGEQLASTESEGAQPDAEKAGV